MKGEHGLRLKRWPLSVILLLLVVPAALLAPLVAPYPPNEIRDPAVAGKKPPGTRLFMARLTGDRYWLAESVRWEGDELVAERNGKEQRVNRQEILNATADGVADRRLFLLGTDSLGHDLFSRLLYGARTSLTVGVIAALLAMSLGIAVGSVAALGGDVADELLMRCVDGLLAIPGLILLLAVTALLDPEPWALIVILGCTNWMSTSRLVRAELRGLRQRDFALASRALGMGPLRLWFRHLLPNALTPVVVDTALRVGDVILLEATLSFLGLGLSTGTVSWGAMIDAGRAHLTTAWWIAFFPGLALTVTVLLFNLAADGLRDLLDPRTSAVTRLSCSQSPLRS